MKKRMINTSIWYDEKFGEASWLEKVVFQHLLLRRELTTVGVVVTTVESIEALLNGSNPNEITSTYPRLERPALERALEALEARRMIVVDRNGELTIWFRNFLKYQEWSQTVVASWPAQIKDVPSKRIRGMVRRSCRAYCKSKNYSIPGGL